LGIDVDQCTTLIPLDLHITLHDLGFEGEDWNENWADWLAEAEENGYTANDAAEHLYEMLQPYLRQLEEIGILRRHPLPPAKIIHGYAAASGLNAIVPYPR
jgi:hypothetical protein